jgi:uncharacterized protein (AIM24 family)
MANYEIIESEGMRYVRISIANETVRAEAGALSFMTGGIDMRSPVPSPITAIKNILSEEPIIRPRYTGTGSINLEPSFHGYHIFEVAEEPWILEHGAFWASDGSVELGLYRDGMITSFWGGDGFINYQTKVSGKGQVVLNAAGPVQEVSLHNDQISVEGRLVIARTAGLQYRVRRPTSSYFSYLLSGEDLFRVYRGTGKVLMTVTPFWNQRLLDAFNR